MGNSLKKNLIRLSERMNNLNYQKGVYEENNEKNKENHLGNDRLKEMRQENVELKNQVMNQKEICDNYRKVFFFFIGEFFFIFFFYYEENRRTFKEKSYGPKKSYFSNRRIHEIQRRNKGCFNEKENFIHIF